MTQVTKAIFAAGCFWGVEAAFRKVKGVINTTVGYTGGQTNEPSYKMVCSGTTGHAEAVLIEYDSDTVSYNQLLEIFFSIHDPTTLNRQGPDVGHQYRSAIFYLNETQKIHGIAFKERLEAQKRFKKPIVTEITPASQFWVAEEYHQQYYSFFL
ncbi:MAG: peptide-methionine (S)-S-oxide reductase [Promethearchaeota archaeon]|nr:MAG: peptide-methionine (S)-S-oxide reductase [Candidatus Lokiarchaeota archaeon]